MKCDELKPLKNIECAFNTTTEQEQVIAEDSEGNCYGFDSWDEVYLKDEVDAAIAELKQKLQDQCISCPIKMQEDDVVAEFKEKLEDAKATAYAESVDAGMENRRLKRALWLARANNAESQFMYWCARFGVESGFTKTDIRGYSVNTKRRLRTIGEWIEKWKNVKSKCLAKAEEY